MGNVEVLAEICFVLFLFFFFFVCFLIDFKHNSLRGNITWQGVSCFHRFVMKEIIWMYNKGFS